MASNVNANRSSRSERKTASYLITNEPFQTTIERHEQKPVRRFEVILSQLKLRRQKAYYPHNNCYVKIDKYSLNNGRYLIAYVSSRSTVKPKGTTMQVTRNLIGSSWLAAAHTANGRAALICLAAHAATKRLLRF